MLRSLETGADVIHDFAHIIETLNFLQQGSLTVGEEQSIYSACRFFHLRAHQVGSWDEKYPWHTKISKD